MMLLYWDGGEETRPYFNMCVTFLVIPTVMNVIISLVLNKKKSNREKIKSVVYAILQLNPIVDAWNVWKGTEMTEDDGTTPMYKYLLGRGIELVLESNPEAIIQLYIIYHSSVIPAVAYYSIASSLVSAAFTMMDCSMMNEQENMVSWAGVLLICCFL